MNVLLNVCSLLSLLRNRRYVQPWILLRISTTSRTASLILFLNFLLECIYAEFAETTRQVITMECRLANRVSRFSEEALGTTVDMCANVDKHAMSPGVIEIAATAGSRNACALEWDHKASTVSSHYCVWTAKIISTTFHPTFYCKTSQNKKVIANNCEVRILKPQTFYNSSYTTDVFKRVL